MYNFPVDLIYTFSEDLSPV